MIELSFNKDEHKEFKKFEEDLKLKQQHSDTIKKEG